MPGAFGRYLAELRRARDKGLREFAEEHGFDAGNLSRLERGKVTPPKGRDVLERYAEALNLEEGSDEWYRFFDLAAADRGEVPADIMEDRELADRLPVLFRTLRGDRVVDEDDLRNLLDIIKGE